jgi:hypothetical protein
MRRGETATLNSLKWEPSTLALGPELTEAIEQRPNPPCLLYSGLELRQGGMARSEAAQSLSGTRNLYRLGDDAGLFHDFENRAPASGFPWRSHQVASFTGARRPRIRRCGAAAQTAAVSPVVWLTCDFSLSAVALRKNSNLLCPERSGVPVAGALNYRHARLLDLRASANLL